MRKKLLDFMQGRFGILWCMAVLLLAMSPVKALLSGQEGVDNVRLDEAHPTEICKLLTNKTASEKAQIKSREIAKRDFKGEFANTQYGVRVEIIGEVKEININGQSGIELFAKAWRGDKQLGFGKDGSVEIERFRIFNPPILVDDPNGDIVRERTDEITGEVKQRKLKENPSEAIRQVIAHNVKLVGKDNGNIVKGKVGNTTSTFYPDANVEVDTVDGQLRNEGNATWAGGRNEANSDSAPGNELEGDKVESAGVGVGKGGDGRYNLYRNIYGFYTGATIGAGEDIASAIFSIYGLGNGVYDNINDAYSYLSVVHSAPASNTSLAVGDWDSFTGLPNNMTEGNDSGERKDLTTFIATAQYYNFTLNTTGVSWIGKGGTNRTWLGIAEGHDIQDQDIGAGTGAGKNSVGYSYFADTAGTTNDPKLVVVHSAPTTNPPTVTTSTATSVTSNSATLNGTVNANGLSTTAWFNYGITSGTYTGTSTTQSVSGSSNTTVSSDISGLSSNTTYYYRIAASNSAGTSYGSEASFTTIAAPTPTPTPTPTDTTAPSGSVSINSGASYTNSTAVTLNLSATDSVGVVGYYASTSLSTPTASASGWNSVTSATSYSGSVSYTLASGDESKTVYVWYKDAAGNVSSTASDSIILDTTAPIVTITSPTSGDTYTATGSTVSLSGNASDSLSGISSVTWSNDKGGSGDASGTTYWSISSISLVSGDNKITVTAKDNVGNTSTDTITVTYTAGTAPTVTTGSATNVTATSATITGTVNANGLSTTAWFEYGTVKGTYGNKTTTQTVTGSNDTTVSITVTGLTSGTTYYYRIAAQNNSGTSYGSEMSFQYSSPGSAPTVTTESATDVTTTTATLNGTVNANGISTTAWFEYGTLSGTYGNKTTTKSVSGSTDTKVSISISGLTSGTTYYFRVVAQNSAGTSYGKEMSFYYSSDQKAPTVATEAATNVTDTSATLNGRCNPNGLSTTAWFEYGTLSGTYAYKTSTQSMSGSSYTNVSAAITGLTAGTTYYYRIVAKNSVGTSYGTEVEFYKSPGTDTTPTPVATPTPTTSPAPTLPPLPTPQVSPSPSNEGVVFGFVNDQDEQPLKGVTITITGKNFSDSSETDENGYYEFSGLSKGNYTLTYEKEGFLAQTQDVSLNEGEVKDLGTVTMEQVVSGKIYGNVVDIKGNPIEFVRLRLKGVKTKVIKTASSDADGFFEFTELDADTYVIVAKKKKYRNTQQKVTLGDGESTEIEIEMKKTSKRVIEMMEDGQ